MELTRRSFIAGAAAAGCMAAVGGDAKAPQHEGIRLRFLGTGAAGGPRHSSVLLEGKTLIDFRESARDMLPPGAAPDTIFYTHSHGDHYNPVQALRLGTIRHVFTQETWAEGARREFAAAAAKLGVPTPEVTPLPFRKPVRVNGLTITGLPANHSTGRITNGEYERTSIYLVEKGPARMLYATDTGGIPGEAAQYIGIDAHIRNGRPITALVMEATTGFGCEDDFRLFVHSTIDTVARTVRVLTKTQRLLSPPDQPVYITHRSHIGYSGNIDADDARLPAPLKCARDGLDVVLG